MNVSIKEVEKTIKANSYDVTELVRLMSEFCYNYSFRPDEDKFPKYKNTDIIDEDKSVKWNREEIERRIAARDNEVKRLNRQYNQVINMYTKAICADLADTYDLSDAEITKIWNYSYEDHHSEGFYEVYAHCEFLCEFYTDCLALRKKRK